MSEISSGIQRIHELLGKMDPKKYVATSLECAELRDLLDQTSYSRGKSTDLDCPRCGRRLTRSTFGGLVCWISDGGCGDTFP